MERQLISSNFNLLQLDVVVDLVISRELCEPSREHLTSRLQPNAAKANQFLDQENNG